MSLKSENKRSRILDLQHQVQENLKEIERLLAEEWTTIHDFDTPQVEEVEEEEPSDVLKE
jgi:hypothetical protein